MLHIQLVKWTLQNLHKFFAQYWREVQAETVKRGGLDIWCSFAFDRPADGFRIDGHIKDETALVHMSAGIVRQVQLAALIALNVQRHIENEMTVNKKIVTVFRESAEGGVKHPLNCRVLCVDRESLVTFQSPFFKFVRLDIAVIHIGESADRYLYAQLN